QGVRRLNGVRPGVVVPGLVARPRAPSGGHGPGGPLPRPPRGRPDRRGAAPLVVRAGRGAARRGRLSGAVGPTDGPDPPPTRVTAVTYEGRDGSASAMLLPDDRSCPATTGTGRGEGTGMAGGARLLRDKPWRDRNSMWLLPTIGCCGLLTWASFLYIGIRGRRRAWLGAAAAYGVATIAYLAIVGSAPETADGTADTSGWRGTAG